MHTNLDRLNELLQNENLPSFRKTVAKSMNNISWLRTALANTENTELKALLSMTPKQLLATHVSTNTPNQSENRIQDTANASTSLHS